MRRSIPMKKTFLAAALVASLCVPAYAAQYTNHGDNRFDSPDIVAEPNHAVQGTGKEQKPVLPITLTGEHAVYDSVSGDFHASGNVVVKQGNQTLHTSFVEGNMKTGEVWLKEGGSFEEQNTISRAEWGHYNFNTKTGELKKLSGQNGKDLFYSPHAEITPEKIVMDEGGTVTRCQAVKSPKCLEIQAKTFEIYPGEKMLARDVKVFVRGKHIYSRDYWESNLAEKNKERILPHIGFKDSDKGVYLNISYERPFSDKDTFYADLDYYTKDGYKPMFGWEHNERNYKITLVDGWDEDDDEWVKKQRDVRFDYKPHYFTKKIPVTYSGYYERGLWRNEDTAVESWHTEYGAFLNHDRIYMFRKQTSLDLTVGKKWTREGEEDQGTSSTDVYYATLNQRLAPKWNTWVGYYREDFTTNLFTYDQPDMSIELRNGIQYKFDDKDTIAIINRYDLDTNSQYETIYRWTHKLCCWQFILEYTNEHYKNDHSIELKYEFNVF